MIEPGTSKAGVPVQIENVAGTIINPSTEDTLLKVPGLSIPIFDAVTIVYNSNNDVYSFRTGGAAGTVVATVTLTYSSTAKTQLNSVVKT